MSFLELRRSLAALRAWRRRVEPRRFLRLVPYLAMGVGLEFLGRLSGADAVDAIGVLMLLSLLIVEGAQRRGTWQELWRDSWKPRVERTLAPWRIAQGLDLRGGPVLTKRLPTRWIVLYAATLGAVILLWFTRGLFPTAGRETLRSISGLLSLASLALLWSALFATCFVAWCVVVGLFDEVIQNSRRLMKRRETWLGWAMLSHLAVSVGGALWLPRGVAFWIIVVTLVGYAVATTLILGPIRLVWRFQNEESPPSWMRWSVLEIGLTSWIGLALLALGLLAGGDRFSPSSQFVDLGAHGDRGQTLVTAFFGATALWMGATSYPTLLGVVLLRLGLARLSDPARDPLPELDVQGSTSRGERRRIREELAKAGIRAHFRPAAAGLGAKLRPPRSKRAAIRVVEAAQPKDFRWSFEWPRPVAPSDLADTELHALIQRRDQIQRRRELIRGFKMLFKTAAARSFKKGEGFWVGPHLWFVTHLTRDTNEEDSRFVGPAYHRSISRAARAHLYEVLGDAQIDLIFLEDGVGFRRFVRVIRMLFEYHDLFPGRALEDERHFSGLPGVRVVIHELSLEEPFRSKTYPEPDYEDLGRARILHIFKDRGGDVEPTLSPEDEWTRPVRGPRGRSPVLSF